MDDIKVFGHKSPDTDATTSAIVWAWFLKNKRSQQAAPYVLSMPNPEALFVLERWDFPVPEILDSVTTGDNVSIVDTNNVDELFANINDCNIVSIIDHHKLTGGIKTSTPREVIIQPYASTMTVMFNVMNIGVAELPHEIAGLMLSGILSDTLAFRSPTTTKEDENLARDLAQELHISIDDYSKEMFNAKSNVDNFSAEELVLMDSKVFEIKGSSLRISVVETTDPEKIMKRKEEILEALESTTKKEGLDNTLFFIVDILEQDATLLIQNQQIEALSERAFNQHAEDGLMRLPGIVSRKKQIIPALSA